MSSLNKDIPILRVENLHKWFGKVHALNDFTFDIYPGEAVSLIGDNGAGKSTFVKIISGVFPQTKGKIFWKNEELKNNSIEMARKVGIETVYQEQTLVSALSITKNIFLGRVITKDKFLRVLNLKEMENKSKEVLGELGLNVSSDQEVRFCSGGERQGVAVARAFLFKAKLVILDEPTRAISPTGVKKVMDFIKGMKDEGIAVILISHVFSQVFQITDRFVILSRGEKILEKKQKDTSVDELTDVLLERH